MNIEELQARLGEFENVDLVGPVSETQIAAAERELGHHLSPQYRNFISKFGCGGIESESFVGLGGPDYLNIVKLRKKLNERSNPLPSHLLPLRTDGFGNYDYLDTVNPTGSGEFAIRQWQHDMDSSKQTELLASTYWDWFESILRLIQDQK